VLELLVSWSLSGCALLLASRLFEGVTLRGDFATALWVAALFAVFSFFLQWFFFVLLALSSLGLGFFFPFVTRILAAAIVLKVTSAMSSRFDIRGIVPSIGTALLLALATELTPRLLEKF
jgi:uncharacterized membrane protein YvlD (DUF360 family)